MRYVLRADASPFIGAGHVMRSSAIAEELIARGKEVIFVGQISNLKWVEERISSIGFKEIHDLTNEFVSNPATDVLILDSYEIAVNDEFIEPKKWSVIISIVDEQTPNYSCTLRVHPGLNANWIGESKGPILAGPKYIPFRSSLSKFINSVSQEQHKLKIVVVAGGSDPYGLVQAIAKILLGFSEQFVACLFSASTLDATLDSRFRYIEVGHQLDELTRDADLVLTTASTSSLEFLARGLCVGIACAVENQKQYYRELGELGITAQLGFRNLENVWELDKEMIYSLVTSSELRSHLIVKAKDLIDFKGASRIVDTIIAL